LPFQYGAKKALHPTSIAFNFTMNNGSKFKIKHDIKYTFAFSACCIQYEQKKSAVEVQLKHIL
jgi:hypothetical protein